MPSLASFLRRHFAKYLALSLALSVLVLGGALWSVATLGSKAEQPAPVSATGTIRSFGPNREYVNIAHDPIEGYMGAMTMPFFFKTLEQVRAVEVGDQVRFDFTADRDGRLILVSLAKK